MDLNRVPISPRPVVLEVRFLFRPKTELRDLIIRHRNEEFYSNLLRSSLPVIIPRVQDGNICYFIYLWISRLIQSKMGDISDLEMHDMVALIQQLQQENANIRHAMEQHQVAHAQVHLPAPVANPVPHPQAPKEPRVSLPDKFDGDRTKLRDFVNQIRLVFRLQPQRYSTEEIQVGFIETLLTGTALSWFSSLLEKNSPLLTNRDQFLEELSRTFGERDRALIATTKLRSIQQRSRPASAYVVEFQQIVCDLD